MILFTLMKKKKTNKETIDQKDFFERKYRIYNDFLISNKDMFREKIYLIKNILLNTLNVI